MSLSYLILCLIILYSAASQVEDGSAFFVLKKTGYGLKNSILRWISAENQLTCAHYCVLDKSKCQSFNFIADLTIEQNCELNSKKAGSPNDMSLVPRNGMTYFEKTNIDEEKKSSENVNSPALKFRGNNAVEYGISNQSRLLDNVKSISVCFWINVPALYTLHSQPAILSYAVGESENEFLLSLQPDLKLYLRGIEVSTGVSLADGTNRHVCVIWKLTSGVVRTYVNGSLAITKRLTIVQDNIRNGGTWIIGQDQDVPGGTFENGNSFKGKMTEVHVWNRVIDEDKIKAMASTCVPIMKGNLKAYTDFEIKGEVETYFPKCGLD